MMGLQATLSTNKRKYEVGTVDYEADSKVVECSPPKSPKYSTELNEVSTVSSTATTNTASVTTSSSKNNNNIISENGKGEESSISKLESVIPPESHQWNGEPIVDSISKLQAVAETWAASTTTNSSNNSSSITTTSPLQPLTTLSSSITLSSLAQTAENITRSTLATTLLDQDDDSEDDFQDDYDFDDDEDDDLLDDQTLLTTNYSPIRYPSPSLTSTRNNYIPAYPKPGGYLPEPYQNCSRTPTAQYGSTNQQQNLRPPYYNGSNNGGGGGGTPNWYYNHSHYEPALTPPPPQTIRCAENGKSYFELGSSSYCGPNNHVRNNNNNNTMKNCCDGRNNLWCTAKQCYKEKRLKMMNLSMFKLARFRQASDQSLYRSVLICNTLKSLEKEIEVENKLYHQQRIQHQLNHQHLNCNSEYGPHFLNNNNSSSNNNNTNTNNNPSSRLNGDSKIHPQPPQKQHPFGSNDSCLSNPSVNNPKNSNNSLNNSYSQPYSSNSFSHNSFFANRITTFNESIPPYDHHPLKDPSSGRATPFPSTASVPSQLASSSPAQSSICTEADSGFGDVEDDDNCSTRTINWGSVLSLSSQSALDPLSSSDLFTNTSSISTSTTQNTTTISSNSSNSTNIICSSSNSTVSAPSPSSSSSILTVSAPSSSPNSIITTLTTVSSCSLESLTASTISLSSSLSNTNWDFPYIDMDLNSSSSNQTSDLYELFPNGYKLTSTFNSMDDLILKSQSIDPILASSSVTSYAGSTVVTSSTNSTNELEQLTHIMVGS